MRRHQRCRRNMVTGYEAEKAPKVQEEHGNRNEAEKAPKV